MDPIEVQRQEYERTLNFLWQKKTQNCVLMNKHEYSQKLQRLLELEDPMVRKTAGDYRLLKTTDYMLQEIDGVRVRKLCKRGTNLLYVPIEDMFGIIYNAHIQLKHAGRNNLQNYFRDKYANITKDCIMTFLNMCKSCPRKKRLLEARESIVKKEMIRVGGMLGQNMGSGNVSNSSLMNNDDVEVDVDDEDNDNMLGSPDENILSPTGNTSMLGLNMSFPMSFIKPHKRERTHHPGETESFTRGQIDVLDMQKQRDGEFGYIFKYTNLSTHEIRLKPMKYGNPQEAADLLIDIYCQQGAPAVLQSLNGRQFVEEVVREVYRIWPECKQLHGEFRPTSSASSSAASSTDSVDTALLEQLVRFQKRNNTNAWATLLRHLQWMYNVNFLPELGRTPIEGTLGKVPSLGLPQSKLLEAIYDKARSEEQIMEYLNDAELLRLSAFCAGPIMEKRARQTTFLDDPHIGSVVHSLSQLSNASIAGTCTTSSSGELILSNDVPQCSTPSTSSYSNPLSSCVSNTVGSIGNVVHSLSQLSNTSIGSAVATATPLDSSSYLNFDDLQQMSVQTQQQVPQQQTTQVAQNQTQAMHVVTQEQVQVQSQMPTQQQHTPQQQQQPPQSQQPPPPQMQQQQPPPQQVAPPPQYMAQHHHYAMMTAVGAQHSPQISSQQQQMQVSQQEMMQVNVSVSQVQQQQQQLQHTPPQMQQQQMGQEEAMVKPEMDPTVGNAQNPGANMMQMDMNLGLVSRALNC